jgi:putative ABC transport system permease protein
MNLPGSLHLAWRYVAHHRTRTALLALALGLTLALPLALQGFLQIARNELRQRAEKTPLVLGAAGSPLELSLNALYFRREGVKPISMKEHETLKATHLAMAIPLYVRFQAQGAPIVGTTLDYFAFRGLRLAEGHRLTKLGDCVLGARLARERGLQPGDTLMSSPEQVFDLAGVYPLQMRIVGVLAESHTADDDAILVDVKTTWIIEGIAHGHDDVVKMDPANVLEKKDGDVAMSNAVRMFTQVTDANLASFHFHGETESFPLTAVLAVPPDAKSEALLLGKYQQTKEAVQLVQPAEQMDALLATLLPVERLALMVFAATSLVVLLIAALVFALSFKLRRREFATLEDIGVSRGSLFAVKALEMLMVGLLALVIIAATWSLVQLYAVKLVRLGVG